MKKQILFVAVVVGLSACKKKSFTCECMSMAPQKHYFDIKAANVKDAEKKCASYTDKPELDGPYCQLKK